MKSLKISIITVCRNAENTIERCIESVLFQDYDNVEFIVIDGYSTDNTVNIIKQYGSRLSYFVSEPDFGIYDAMNKGIRIASGDVVGVLNADDYFADTSVISAVATAFSNKNIDALYGDLDYVNPVGGIVRKWVSGEYKQGAFNWGWMPPHPTFYCKRLYFNNLGSYDLEFGTAADYELMLRFVHVNDLQIAYLNKTMVKMNTGGVSNRSISNRIGAWKNDLKAMGKNGVLFPLFCLMIKPLRKVGQFIT